MTKQHRFEVKEVSLGKLVENPLQPVGRTDDRQMKTIKESLAKYGLISPLSVAPAPGQKDHFMVADGTRRWNAFEGETITCLNYYEDDPLDLFVLLNGVRKNIAGAAWLSSYAGASDDTSRQRVLDMMPRAPRRWIKELEGMVGRDEVLKLGRVGKQSPGIVNAVKTAQRMLVKIDAHLSDREICLWMIKHNMQDMVNRLHKDHEPEPDVRLLKKAIVNDARFVPKRVARAARETLRAVEQAEASE